jgi:hypothetical protein
MRGRQSRRSISPFLSAYEFFHDTVIQLGDDERAYPAENDDEEEQPKKAQLHPADRQSDKS